MKNKTFAISENLRLQAEQALKNLRQSAGGKPSHSQDLEIMFQELQVHQIELEMQNDELRIVNEELEIQQLKFAGIYNLAPIGYFILSETGVIEEANDAAYTGLMAGGKANIIGKALQRFMPLAQSDGFYRFLELIRRSSNRQSIQLKMVSTDGHEFDAQLEGISVRPAHSGRLQFYIAIVDISESIRAKQHLSETSERLELALQTSNASIWELDAETMKFDSDELAKLSEFEQTYSSFLNLLHPDDREATDLHFRTAINQEHEIYIICRVTNQLGDYNYYSLTGHLVNGKGNSNCFVGIMMNITDRKKAEQETEQLKQSQQKELTKAVLNGQENARKRISEALHDGVSQLLYGIKMKLETLTVAEPAARNSVFEMLNVAIAETRNISFELAPSILTDFGLTTTLEELAKRLSGPQMKITTRFSGMADRLELSLETSIFRIIQELINNCMKHSDASLVIVDIKKNKTITIVVKDNGRGFLINDNAAKSGGAGLSSIRNRVNLYNGTMHLESEPGKGTQVKIVLPVDQLEN